MIKNRGNVSGRDISPLCFRNMRIYQREMTPVSIGGEKQIRISGGCQSPSDIRSARMRRDSEKNDVSRADPNPAPRLAGES